MNGMFGGRGVAIEFWGERLRLGVCTPSYTMSPRVYNSGFAPRAIRCRPVWGSGGVMQTPFPRGLHPHLGVCTRTRGSHPELYDVAPFGALLM